MIADHHIFKLNIFYLAFLKEKMSRNRLDLNNMLAKYDGYSSTSNLHGRTQQQLKLKTQQTQDSYYRTFNPPSFIEDQSAFDRSQPIKSSFNMSKSQVEQFLLSIKNQLKQQCGQITRMKEHAIRQCYDKFDRNHEKIKHYIFDMIEKTFLENKKAIKLQLERLAKADISQINVVYRRIASIQSQVNGLLNSLKGVEYKKVIAEVVVRDFNSEINGLRANMAHAGRSYGEYLGEIQADSSKIEGIKGVIENIFYFSRKGTELKTKPVEEEGFFSIFKDKTQMQNNTENNQSRIKKSFFNFNF